MLPDCFARCEDNFEPKWLVGTILSWFGLQKMSTTVEARYGLLYEMGRICPLRQ